MGKMALHMYFTTCIVFKHSANGLHKSMFLIKQNINGWFCSCSCNFVSVMVENRGEKR